MIRMLVVISSVRTVEIYPMFRLLFSPNLHLKPSSIGDTILRADVFFSDMSTSAERDFTELQSNSQLQARMLDRLQNIQEGGAISQFRNFYISRKAWLHYSRVIPTTTYHTINYIKADFVSFCWKFLSLLPLMPYE